MALRIFDKIKALVQTTDATQTTLCSFTIPSNSSAVVRATISLRNTANNDTAAIMIVGTFKNNAGTVTLEGSVTSLLAIMGSAGLLTALSTMDVSGTNIRIRVTGIIATTIDWQVEANMINN